MERQSDQTYQTPSQQPALADARPVALAAGILGLLTAGLFAVMWLAGIHDPQWTSYRMKTNTALGLVGISIALLIRARRWRRGAPVAQILAASVTVLAAATLSQYLTGLSLGLDQLIASDLPAPETGGFPNRMAPNSALTLCALGVSLLLAGSPRRGRALIGQGAAMLALAICVLAEVGYLYETTVLYQPTQFIRMTPYTAGVAAILAIGALALRSDLGFARLVTSRGSSGRLARRLMLPAAAAPLLLGWLSLEGVRAGRFETATGTALLVLVTAGSFVVTGAVLASTLDRMDVRRRLAEAQVQQSGALTAALAGAATLDQVVDVTVRLGVPALGASAGGIMLPTADGKELRIASVRGYPDDLVSAFFAVPHDGAMPASEALRTQRPLFISSLTEEAGRYPGLAHEHAAQHESWAALPLRGSERTIGVLCLSYRQRQAFDRPQRERLVQLADQCGQALDRALLFDERAAANRSKDEFMAMLGHELRNPLSPILTALQIMKLRDRETHRKERAIIERQVQHMARLVDDLLDVSRITRGKVELKRQRVQVRELIAHAVEVASPLFEERVHRVYSHAPAGLAVLGDEQRLSQVLTNLLTNAAKYTEPGGRIDVNARRIGDQVEIDVRDNGVGISTELLPRVFELFTQGYRAPDRSGGGLGLGLAIVRMLVEMHGGQVAVLSPGRGQGSVFTVRLPVDDSQPEDTGVGPFAAKPERTAGGGRRVLVVDDNRDAAETLAEALMMAGHQARVAFDGPGGLAIATEFRPELAFLDIGLPVMDGYELARRLRTLDLEPLTLVAITGYGQPADRARSAASGFDEHLVKPIDLDSALAIADDRQVPRSHTGDGRSWG
jgi:signal transduction histidine kinase/ActR/RegA family two-component response regulator